MDEYTEAGGKIEQVTAYRGTSESGLAIDSEEHLYKADGSPEVNKISVTGEGLGEPDGVGNTTGLTIDSATNDLYAVQGGEYVNHFAFNCGQDCAPLDAFGAEHLSGASGIALSGTSGTAYVASPGTNDIVVFNEAVIPDVTTGATSALTPKSVTVAGHVDPAGGGNVSTCEVEYASEAYFQAHHYAGAPSKECSPALPYSEPKDISADITGLTANTTYHYRVTAQEQPGLKQRSGSDLHDARSGGVRDHPARERYPEGGRHSPWLLSGRRLGNHLPLRIRSRKLRDQHLHELPGSRRKQRNGYRPAGTQHTDQRSAGGNDLSLQAGRDQHPKAPAWARMKRSRPARR